jgi:hypothetical protein
MLKLPTKTAPVAGFLLAAILAGGSTATAGSFDFLFNVSHVSNDNQLFLNLTVANAGYPRTAIEPILPRLTYVETDLPVVLFLAQVSHRPVDFIVAQRTRGMSWSAVFGACSVPYSVLFTGIDRDPGPPYGRAWGYWKKNPKTARFSDQQIAGLVQIQFGSRWAGQSPYELARARGQGRPVAVMVADKHGRPYRAHGPDRAGFSGGEDDDRGPKGKASKGKGHSKD